MRSAVLLALLAGALAAQAAKPGACSPDLPQFTTERTCFQDEDCPLQYKCCPTVIGGTVCSPPVTVARNSGIVKAGSCPSPPPRKPWVCSNRCSMDSHCPQTLKCCRSRCGGQVCMRPDYTSPFVAAERLAGLMGE